MRTAEVLYKNILAGLLTETYEGKHVFQYDSKAVIEHPKSFII
jgi:serine/threonine-protein kinase HipA